MPQGKREDTAIQLVVVVKFVVSLWVQLNSGARNVYFHNFEPREGYEPTGSRLKPKNQCLEFCAFLSFQPLVVLILSMSRVNDWY